MIKVHKLYRRRAGDRMTSGIRCCCLIFALVMMANYRSTAQNTDGLKLLKNIKGLSADDLSYDYNVSLINQSTHQVLDRVSGKCRKSKAGYIDSNAVQINMRDPEYTLQINTKSRTAYVKTLKALASKSKGFLDAPTDLLDLDKLQGDNEPQTTVSKSADGSSIVLVRFRNNAIESLTAIVTSSMTLRSLTVKMVSTTSSRTMLERVLVMDNFSSPTGSEAISTTRYMNKTGTGFKLKGKFSSYKVTVII